MSKEYYGYPKEIHELALKYLESYVIINQSYLVEAALQLPESFQGIELDNLVNLYDENDKVQKIFEWWMVDRWLATQLEALGQPVLFADCGTYWGRTCTGQAIILDGTLQEIAKKSLPVKENNLDHSSRIAALNDLCRKSVMMPVFGKKPCHVVMTRGIASLSPQDQIIIAAKVRDFEDFSDENDPYGERDFGAFVHNDQKIFWKIDYYAPDMMQGSEDPSDPDKTQRVLTILLAEEY